MNLPPGLPAEAALPRLDLNLLVVARAQALEGPNGLCFQNLDGVYLDGIAGGITSLTLLAPVQRLGKDATASICAGYSHTFRSPNLQLVELPDYKTSSSTLLDGLRQVLAQFRLIWCAMDGHDTVFVMMSTFRAAFAAVSGAVRGRRVILYSGNDWYADMESSYKFRGPVARVLYRPFRWFCGFAERRAMRAASLRILNGASLLRKYGELPGRTVETRPLLTIRPADMLPLRDTCQGPEFRLLCVAGLMPRKGIHFLLDALRLLVDRGIPVRLVLVGGEQPAYGRQVREQCTRLGLDRQVDFAGYVANGPDLITEYRQSDVFVLPSLSEGFPRVIFEAMAQCLPVVANRITNIEGRLGDAGLVHYAAPGDPADLARALGDVLTRPELRQGLIRKGRQYIAGVLEVSPVGQFLQEVARMPGVRASGNTQRTATGRTSGLHSGS